MHGGGQGFESPQLHQKPKTIDEERLPSNEAPIAPNKAVNHLPELIDGFILQLRIEGYSPRTIDTYRRNLNTLAQYLCDTDIASVTPQDIRLFLAQVREAKPGAPANRKDGLSTVDRHWVTLRSFFKWLCSEGILNSSPVTSIKAPKQAKRIVTALTPEEIGKLLNAIDNNHAVV